MERLNSKLRIIDLCRKLTKRLEEKFKIRRRGCLEKISQLLLELSMNIDREFSGKKMKIVRRG